MSALLTLALLTSGLHGIVTRGPTMPVCKVGAACTAPAVGATLVFSRGGRVVARTKAGAHGRYSVRLAPGYYAVRLATTPKIGSGIRPREAHVRAGVLSRVDFAIDTGIR